MTAEARPIERAPRRAAGVAAGPCDFCSDPTPTHVLPCRPLDELGPDATGRGTGEWAACDCCAGLIEADRWAALTDRTISSIEAATGGAPLSDAMRRPIEHLHLAIRHNTAGPLRPCR